MSSSSPQSSKRSRIDSDVVFVSATVGHNARRQQNRAIREAKEALYHRRAAAQEPVTQSYSSVPFHVPSLCISPEPKDVCGGDFLGSVAKSRKQEKAASLMPTFAIQLQQTHNSDVIQPMLKPFVCLNELNHLNDNSNSVMVEGNYHDVELIYDQQKPKVDDLITVVIQNAAYPPNYNQQYVPTPTESSLASDGSNETPSSPLKKFYDIHEFLGAGTGGSVYAGARKVDGIQVAIKEVSKANVHRWGTLGGRVVPIEFELLHRVSHSGHTGVIGMLDWYEYRSTYILVMERPHPVMDLLSYINQYGALSETKARAIFRQLAEAVLHCHANGVVHRDIKDDNVLLNLHTSEAKLIDFGCGTVLKNTPYTEFAGTPVFYPPEWFTDRSYYGQRVDAWSLGVLLFTMVEAVLPFPKEQDVVECILQHKRADDLSESCKNLIEWMLQKDQDMRPTIEQALKHPWFNENSIAAQAANSTVENNSEKMYKNTIQHNDPAEDIPNFANVPEYTESPVYNVVSPQYPETPFYNPDSPARHAVQEDILYHGQTACASNIENSATGLSSNYMIVRDRIISLASAPSSSSAGSVGGSRINGYLVCHMTPSAAQYKGSLSSSVCSTTGPTISSSSTLAFSLRSSMSSSPCLIGISPRKRHADDDVNGESYCEMDSYPRRCEDGITNSCCCEVCTTDRVTVTGRTHDSLLRDAITVYHGQRHKRSRNDSDVVFVSTTIGPNARKQENRTIGKARKSVKKALFRQTPAEQEPVTQAYSSFPFVLPSPYVSPEAKDVSDIYCLGSAAKRHKPDKDASLMPKSVTQLHQSHNSDVIQPMLKPFVCLDEMDDNINSVMVDGCPNGVP